MRKQKRILEVRNHAKRNREIPCLEGTKRTKNKENEQRGSVEVLLNKIHPILAKETP
jgi:hypothetical protein